MRVKTAFILCAGLGKGLNPITLKTPKPLLKLNDKTMLEKCINMILELGIKKIFLNTFHLGNQISEFIKNKNSQDENFIIFNPDTLWGLNYLDEINNMQNLYFSNNLENILLCVKKNLSFDKDLKGDFNLINHSLRKNKDNDFIFIGCQILNKSLFNSYKLCNFSISEIWDELLNKNELNGFESVNKFYHLTNKETFKKLQDL